MFLPDNLPSRVVIEARGYSFSRWTLTRGAKRNRKRSEYVFGKISRWRRYSRNPDSKSEPVRVYSIIRTRSRRLRRFVRSSGAERRRGRRRLRLAVLLT